MSLLFGWLNDVHAYLAAHNGLYIFMAMLVMFIATYIPRAVPLLFCRRQLKSAFIRSFLFYMPYAVLAALTFPSIFYSTGSRATAVIGTVIALAMSMFEINLAIVASVCVAVVFGLSFVLK